MPEVTLIEMYPQDVIYKTFGALLDELKKEKSKESNKEYGREIAVTITELEKAYAYFVQYVYPNYFKESSE